MRCRKQLIVTDTLDDIRIISRLRTIPNNRDLSRQLATNEHFCDLSCPAFLCHWVDIVIHAEEIGGIVFLFDCSQAWQVRTECCLNNVFFLDVERRKQVCVLRERP